MKTRADYDRAFAIVRDVIHAWDPYALRRGGAPSDEWDGEITRIVVAVPEIISPQSAAAAISRVFTASFEAKGFTPADCAEVGQRLYAALQSAGITP